MPFVGDSASIEWKAYMPTLKRAEDGHWFIRAFVFAAGHLGTWQVAEEGIEWLRRRRRA